MPADLPIVDLPSRTELWLLMPELVLCVGMVAVLFAAMVRRRGGRGGSTAEGQSGAAESSSSGGGLLAAGGPALAVGFGLLTLVAGMVTVALTVYEPVEGGAVNRLIFHETLAIDPFSQFFKLLLMLCVLLVLLQWLGLSRRQDDLESRDWPDYVCLLLGAALGMSLLASARDLLVVLIAMETASLPSYMLAGIRKRRRTGAEAAMKYVLIGAVATGLMVYGMSLLYGASGSLKLEAIAASAADGITPLWAIGMTLMFVGIAFKLSAVPLHFWCPDVFEGAPFDVTTFLSVASKGAAVVFLARLLDAFGAHAEIAGTDPLLWLAIAVGIFGGVTATWGNVVALQQSRLRRMLAYSSIAQAGYMIMACSVLVGARGGHSAEAASAILFYLTVYLFMNVGAFTVAARISDQAGSEEMEAMSGWVKYRPVEVVLLAVFLLSLFGLPTLGGFLGKWYLAATMGRMGDMGIVLVAVLLLNTLFSLAFYLRPLYFMVLKPAVPPYESLQRGRLSEARSPLGPAVAVFCAFGVVWTGLDLGASSVIGPFGRMDSRAPARVVVSEAAESRPAGHAAPSEDEEPAVNENQEATLPEVSIETGEDLGAADRVEAPTPPVSSPPLSSRESETGSAVEAGFEATLAPEPSADAPS